MISAKNAKAVAVGACLSAAALTLAACGGSSNSSSANGAHGSTAKKFKIALSMSYTGNDWQNEAANLIKAEAKTPPYDKLVSLRVDVAGTDVTKQIQTIQNEVAAGMNAIIVYPISPTALNPTIEQACQKGVVVFAYDSLVTAPCAYNVHDDLQDLGFQGADWLAKQLHGNGKIVVVRGVSGTSADLDEYKGVQKALKPYPGIKVVAQPDGNWDQAQIKTVFSSAFAAHPDINGVWSITGCQPIHDVTKSASHPVYCTGGMTQAEMLLMAPKDKGGSGLTTNFGVGTPAYNGELALIQAVQVLQGQKLPHDTVLPTTTVTSSQVKMGTDAAAGDNVFPPGKVAPGFFNTFWNPLVEQGLQAAINGSADKVSSAQPCDQVTGCRQNAQLQQ